MQLNLNINDSLVQEALLLANTQDKDVLFEKALTTLVTQMKQAEIRAMRGKLNWQGDLNAMRENRV